MAVPQMRYWSNKENSSPSLIAPTSFARTHVPHVTAKSPSKPRVSGIGRVPKPSRQHPSTKPYDRVTSIQRAKLRAAKGNKHKSRPTPLHLASSTGTKGRYRQPDRTVHIPLQLPKPVIPPVVEVDGTLTHVPPSYTLDRLRPFLPTLFAVSQMYHPQPHLNHPLLDTSHRPTMAFAVPELLEEDVDGIHDGFSAKIRGMEPDICVAVTGKAARAGGVPRIYAVKEVVLQVYCAYWPDFVAPTAAEKGKNPIHEPPRSLSPVAECTESDTESDTSSNTIIVTSPADGSSGSTSTLTESPDHILHLPIIPLSLPSPESFPTLLVHLHTPSRPFTPKVLGLPSTITERRDIIAEMEKLSVPELMTKLGYIHSMWKNACALGISDERTWSEMASAWSCVVSVLAGKGGGWAWAEKMKSEGSGS